MPTRLKPRTRLSRTPLAGVCLYSDAKLASLLFDAVLIAGTRFEHADGLSDLENPHSKRIDIWTVTPSPRSLSERGGRVTNSLLFDLSTQPGSLSHFDHVPLYSSEAQYRDAWYHPAFGTDSRSRDQKIYQVILENVPVVQPASMLWEHIADAREDPAVIEGFRSLRLWLSEVGPTWTEHQIEDHIQTRLRQYSAILRKHSITSATGTIKSLIDPAKIATLSAVGLGVAHMTTPEYGVLSGLALIGTEISVRVADYLVERTMLKGDYAEVAVLADVARLAAPSRKPR